MPRSVVGQLWRGESDQPPQTRLEGQLERSLNARLDVTFSGPVRRNPTNLIADLAALTAATDYFVVQIRDALVFLAQAEVKAFRMTDGVALTVIDNTPATDLDLYLQSGTSDPFVPNEDLVAAVSVDTAVIVNRTITAQSLTGWSYQQTMNFIELGDEDGTGGTAVLDNTGTLTQKFSDLPTGTSVVDGQVERVIIDENNDPAGVYIAFSGTPDPTFPDGFYPAHGVADTTWYRIPTELLPNARWNLATMPHTLLYDENANTVTFDRAAWKQRISGNQATNRISHVNGVTIEEVDFMASRLMLPTQNHLVGSRNGDFFNLWLNNAGVPNDEDRIDLDLATFRNMGRPLRTMVIGQSMLLGLENGQLSFGSGGAPLTAINGSFRIISKFPTRDIHMGEDGSTGFLVDKHGWVHQYKVFDIGNVSVLGYLSWANLHRSRLFESLVPLRLFAIDRSLFVTTDDGKVVVHDQFTASGEILQSAWSALDFFADTAFVANWNDRIYLVQNDATGFSIVDYQHNDIPAPTGMLYPPRLDRSELVSGTYDSVADETTFTHTGRSGDSTSTLVTNSPGPTHVVPAFVRVESNGDVVFSGGSGDTDADWDADSSGAIHFLGFAFTSEIELNEFWPNLDETVVTVSLFTVHHFEASDYEIVIPRLDKDDDIIQVEARRLPFQLGTARTNIGFSRNNIVFDGRRVRPIIRSSSPGQFTIIGVAYTYVLQDAD